MKTVHTEKVRIKDMRYLPAKGVWRYHLVDGSKLYQVAIYFRPDGAVSGSVRGCKRLHGTMTACEKYRARLRQRLGDSTI